MKKTFTNIIIALTLFIGIPVFAQMQCDGFGNCTGTYSLSGGGNMGAFTPPATVATQGSIMSAEAARQKACGEAKGAAEAARGKCLWQASDKRDKFVAKCPQDTEVIVGIPGVVSATTTPRTSCIENAAGVKSTDDLKCQSDYLNTPIPSYCPR